MVKQALKQIAEDTIEGLKGQAQHTGSTAKRESVNIVKELFGQGDDDEQLPQGSTRLRPSTSSGLRTGEASSTETQNPQLSVLAQQKELERQEELAAIRRRKDQMSAEAERLRLEEDKEEQEQEAEAQGAVAEQKQIKQLRQEEDKREALAPKHLKGMQGTREMGPRKGF